MILAAGVSDSGCRRKHNEDRILVETALGLFVVADGRGGERCGGLAAELAVRAVGDYRAQAERAKTYAWPFGYDPALPGTQNRVLNAVRLANRRVFDAGRSHPDCDGMGTTISTLFIDAETATVGNIGDSRVYLFRGRRLRQLTRDDALTARLVESGDITAEEARIHPLKNVLTLALGRDAEIAVQLVEFALKPGDRLLLASDGLHGVLEDPAIVQNLETSPDSQIAAQRLVDAAKERGAPDNVSCIVVGYF
jgi:protein phosphatase